VLTGGGLLLDCTGFSVSEVFVKSSEDLAACCLVRDRDGALVAASAIGFDTTSFALDVDIADLLATALILPRSGAIMSLMDVDWR
jgi:hypothetical protein